MIYLGAGERELTFLNLPRILLYCFLCLTEVTSLLSLFLRGASFSCHWWSWSPNSCCFMWSLGSELVDFCSAEEEDFNSSSSKDDFSIFFLCPFVISCPCPSGEVTDRYKLWWWDGIKLNAVAEGRYLVVHGTRAARAKAWLVYERGEVSFESEPVCVHGSKPVPRVWLGRAKGVRSTP